MTKKHIILIPFVSLILLVSSCVDKQELKVAYLVKKWENKTIHFTSEFAEYETSVIRNVNSDFKLFVYSDTLDCYSCQLNFRSLERFMMNVSEINPNVELLICTCPETIPGTCGSTAWTGDSWATVCNVAYCCAQNNLETWNVKESGMGFWCCDSCPTTVYCGTDSSY